MKIFAAIDIGSYELSMKIYEISPKIGIREIDHIRHRIELGTDTFSTGKISYQRVDELCEVLLDFISIMKSYKTNDYKVCATSAIRETENATIILDQIKMRTGLTVNVLSNSEQRFLGYKSIAAKETDFNKIIEKGTAIVDVGGGSIQISLFDRDSLVTTQNIRLGILRIREKLADMQLKTSHFESLIEELINNELYNFKKLYLKDREIKHIIAIDDYISYIIHKVGDDFSKDFIKSEKYMKFVEILKTKEPIQVAKELGFPYENASLFIPSAIVLKRIIEETKAELIWTPGVTLTDGMAYDYAEKNRIIQVSHNFDNDILACARNIAKRYMSNKGHSEILNILAVKIFDSMMKIHGLSKRERLLLQIAVILHDCGKYISLTAHGECAYHIVMSTEIIGLSHLEREMVANIVKFNTTNFIYYEDLSKTSKIDSNAYLIIAKLTAMLRVANALDRSHKEKFKSVEVSRKDKELIITVNTMDDITLEKGLFKEKADFFEEVFSIRPIIKQKKIL